MKDIILLNADYSFLNTITWKRAMVLVSKGKVEILKYSNHIINGVMKLPAVCVLLS